MVEGEQQIGGWKRPVAGLKPAIIVTVVGIGEAEEKFIFSTKMVVKGAAGITGEFDDLRDRSFVIALFCEQFHAASMMSCFACRLPCVVIIDRSCLLKSIEAIVTQGCGECNVLFRHTFY